jgi:hypothetical protein
MKVAEIAILTFAFICGGLSIYWSIKAHNSIKMPCGVSEISPDFSNQDREKCRVMRGHKL